MEGALPLIGRCADEEEEGFTAADPAAALEVLHTAGAYKLIGGYADDVTGVFAGPFAGTTTLRAIDADGAVLLTGGNPADNADFPTG